eukprot:g5350.t1
MRISLISSLQVVLSAAAAANVTHSVVHVIVDDLRPELGAYGLPTASTPNIDALARDGTVFDRAFCQQSVCGPSRNSFLTGRFPDRSRSWNFINSFRDADSPSANWTTLPGLFLRAGALALGAGKVFHPKVPAAYDGRRSWSDFGANLPFQNPCWNTADHTSSKGCNKTGPASASCDGGLPCFFCPIDILAKLDKKTKVSVQNEWCTVDAVEDSETVNKAVRLLRAAAKARTPFYLAVGLHKPHMPWQFSAQDLAKHPANASDVAAARVALPPVGMPPLAFHMSDQSADAAGGGTHAAGPWAAPLTPAAASGARRAYRAAVTGMDRKLGKLLDALDGLGLAGSTAVVLHGDHGWHLGEQGEWRKMTAFEAAARVPLIVRAPWLRGNSTAPAPARSSALVQLVDVLPTVAELAGVPLPPGETFDGVSAVPLLRAPTGPGATTAGRARAAAFTQYPRRVKNTSAAWKDNSIVHADRRTFTHMGYSARVDGWRYTEWLAWNQSALLPLWNNVTARELYDFRAVDAAAHYPTDFDASETINVANRSENAALVANLSAVLRAHYTPLQSAYSDSGSQ